MKPSLLLWWSALIVTCGLQALGQGGFFLANDWQDSHAPLFLLDSETDEAFALYGPEWRLEVRGGPRSAAGAELKPLATNEFMPWVRGGCIVPRHLTVPGVAPGAEATVQLLVVHRDRPGVKIPVGTYTVELSDPKDQGRLLPLGNAAMTNVAPKELADLLPRRPAIPGEPTYKGKRLSYWFGDLMPERRFMKMRRDARRDPMLIPRQGHIPPRGMNLDPGDEDDATAAVRSAGAAGIPVLLHYSAPDKSMTQMVVREISRQYRIMGLLAKVNELALTSLSDTNPVVLCNALDLLPCGPAESEVERLTQFVKTGAPEVQTAALQVLNRCRITNSALLSLYQSRLTANHPADLWTVLTSLKAFGAEAKPLLPQIQPLLEKENPMIRAAAAGALWSIDQRTNVLAVLIKDLEQSTHLGFSESLRELGEMGPAAKPAVPAIIKAAERANHGPDRDPTGFFLRQAAEAIKKIDPDAVEKLPPDPMRRFRRPGLDGPPGVLPPPRPQLPDMPLG